MPVPCPVIELHDMIRHLLATRYDDPAELVTTLTPLGDFDGDGVSDEDEIASGTDPWGAAP